MSLPILRDLVFYDILNQIIPGVSATVEGVEYPDLASYAPWAVDSLQTSWMDPELRSLIVELNPPQFVNRICLVLYRDNPAARLTIDGAQSPETVDGAPSLVEVGKTPEDLSWIVAVKESPVVGDGCYPVSQVCDTPIEKPTILAGSFFSIAPPANFKFVEDSEGFF
jgi:hypothetical protein